MPASEPVGFPATAVPDEAAPATGAPALVVPAPIEARPAVGAWLRFLGSEMRLMLSRRRNQAGLGVLAAIPIVMAIAVKIANPNDRGQGASFLDKIVGNGFFVALAALIVEIGLFLPLAIAMLSGDAVAGEAQIGTLRNLLVVPVARTRLLATKYVSLVIGSFLGVMVVAVAGLVAGGALFGLHPVTTLSGTTLPLATALLRLLVVVLYVTAFLAALSALGLFVSTLTEQPLGATVAVAIISTTMWILDSIPQLGWLHPWLLVDKQVALADVLRDPIYWPTMRLGLLTDLAYIVIFLLAAWARFSDKDISG
jgi:ABC-2 type transport system permease protein